MRHTLKSNSVAVLLLLVVVVVFLIWLMSDKKGVEKIAHEPVDSTWVAPSLSTDRITAGNERDLVNYGKELLAHTGKYFGPKGSVKQISNGMNCQNCHLDAGTRAWGNNLAAVYATYPRFRDRSGSVEDIPKRVNDCFKRSLNGHAIDTASREMQAIYHYIKWLGKDVPKGKKPIGSGLEKLPFLDRPANPDYGKQVYINKCKICHGSSGEGLVELDKNTFAIPPLWGKQSYNDGAGLYRLSNFAAFVKNTMPFGQASHGSPVLTLEEAWDIAAYVNTQERPHIDQRKDWPDITKKPVDFPFGPFADTFSETQHKYGPFQPIVAARNKGMK